MYEKLETDRIVIWAYIRNTRIDYIPVNVCFLYQEKRNIRYDFDLLFNLTDLKFSPFAALFHNLNACYCAITCRCYKSVLANCCCILSLS